MPAMLCRAGAAACSSLAACSWLLPAPHCCSSWPELAQVGCPAAGSQSLCAEGPGSVAGQQSGLEIPSRLCLCHALTSVLTAWGPASDLDGNKTFPWAGVPHTTSSLRGCGDHSAEAQGSLLATKL